MLAANADGVEKQRDGAGDWREGRKGPVRPADLEDSSTWYALLPGASDMDYKRAAAANPCIRGSCHGAGRTMTRIDE